MVARMHPEKLTDTARTALEAAFRTASELRHPGVEPEHLLLALASDREGPAAQLLQSVDVDLGRLEERLRARLGERPTADHVAPSDQYLSRELSQVIDSAEAEASRRKDRYTSVDQLLLGLASVASPARELLEEFGVRPAALRASLERLRGASGPVESRGEEAQYQALE